MDLAAKLQLRGSQHLESVLCPESIRADLREVESTGESDVGAALIVFVIDCDTLEQQRTRIVEAAAINRLTWVSYPKSGQLGTDLNRDSLAAVLKTSGIQPVRQIAINDVWTALRFRPS
jgi:hypothetical protein